MKESGLTVLAIGGNALIDPELPPTVDVQFNTTHAGTGPVADLLLRGERLVITHGNGPQVGFLLLRMEMASETMHQVPLDSLVADTQGSLGYMIQRALRQHLREQGSDRLVATLVTEVVVDAKDEAFSEPTKPIGKFYGKEEAARRTAEDGWVMVEDAGRGYRRVVASPSPVEIVQLEAIRMLADQGVTVIACGGGGIPVTLDEFGDLQGQEAVIDKDRTSALLAVSLGADRLVISTAVDAVYRDFGTENAKAIHEATLEEMQELAAQGQFPPGSMGPKIEAASYFLHHGGSSVTICAAENLVEAFDGNAGTTIRRAKP